MGCGIYKIENKINNKIYVGSSINIEKRLQTHKIMLNGDYHDNKFLQSSVNKYGIKNFIFEILEFCEEKQLVEKENFFINKFNTLNHKYGYNLANVSDNRRNIFTTDVKIKMSRTKLNNRKNFFKFKLINTLNGSVHIFDNLVEAAIYLKNTGLTKTDDNLIRNKLSICLRGKKVNNGVNNNGSVRRTIYKHKWEIIY